MKIAIQGHPTRGKEVIQILESLGSKNGYDQSGSNEDFVYFINSVGLIYSVALQMCSNERRIYTLEEFEKEFPFKVGDEVIFPVKTGWASGKVTGLTYVGDQLKYEVDHRIAGYCYVESRILQLYPMKKKRNITLTLDKAKEWYNKGGELKEIALQAYSEEELTKLELPKTWEEFCNKFPVKPNEAFIYITGQGESDILSFEGIQFTRKHNIKHMCASKKSAEAHLAMIQLERLRDCWWNGWEPEWNNCEKYVIKCDKDDFIIFTAGRIHAFLVFPTKHMAEEFLECFRDLIEKAGDLI